MDWNIRTERLRLRQFREDEASALREIAGRPEILRWMPDWAMSEEQLRGRIRHFLQQIPLAGGTRARVMLAVEREGELIGMCGIGNKPELDGEVEIDYFLHPDRAGAGYMREAAGALSRMALERLEIPYLAAIVEPDNLPSRRVVERCGFVPVETRMIHNAGEAAEKPFLYYRLTRNGAG